MKNLYYPIILGLIALLGVNLQSCDNHKTYGELVDEENDAIEAFILKNDIKVISVKDFVAKDSTTAENEYVYFEDKGIYMNIIKKGVGKTILQDGTYDILSRFMEVAIDDIDRMGVHAGDTLVRNMYANGIPSLYLNPEEYKVTIKDKSYSGNFQGTSLMYQFYDQLTAVPGGWLLPLQYVKPTRTTESDNWARVKLIVPHSEGTNTAMRFVYPCFYEITYNLGK